MKTTLFTALALLFVSFSFNTVSAETRVTHEKTTQSERLSPPQHEYISGRVVCLANGNVCVATFEGVHFRAVNGHGMLQSGRVNVGEMVTARVIRRNGPGGMGEVTIIII